ncbi:ATP-dependent RNA helicase, putative [Medicago truncatula]|uniref:RNA helicase n=1 Tax=Medicago truncatula TaxID=3880 RepID=G7JB82_MEDTR|nr:ATP-dependent RNA helicase, putative [Medicago truncatula]
MVVRVLLQQIYNKQQNIILSGEIHDFTSGSVFQTPQPVIEIPTSKFPGTVYFAKKTEKTDFSVQPIGRSWKFTRGSYAKGELEFNDDDDHEDSENKSDILDALGKEGSIVSLKDAFEKLSGQAPLNSSNEMTTFSVNTEEGLDKSKVCSEKIARESHSPSPGALFVLELYAVLPAAAQLRLFEGVKEGKRLVVVATNVAENYDSSNGMETYEVQWISKPVRHLFLNMQAELKPDTVIVSILPEFNNEFPEYSPAEVKKVSALGAVPLKSMHIKKVFCYMLPFPTSLKVTSLLEAENCLKALEALDCRDELIILVKAMTHYTLSPCHYRMILTVIKNTRHDHKCNPRLPLAYAISAAAHMFCRVLDKHKSLEFCEDSTLSLKIMDDMSKLRLRNWSFIRVKVVLNKNTHGFHKTLDDVENAQQNSSKYVLVWEDRIAKRITTSRATDGEMNCRTYPSCMVEESIFVHRWSSLSTVHPEFLIYNEKYPCLRETISAWSN